MNINTDLFLKEVDRAIYCQKEGGNPLNKPLLHKFIQEAIYLSSGGFHYFKSREHSNDFCEIITTALASACIDAVIRENETMIKGVISDCVKYGAPTPNSKRDIGPEFTDLKDWAKSLKNDNNEFYWDIIADDAIGIFSTLSEEIPIEIIDYDEEVSKSVIDKAEEFIEKLYSSEIKLEDAYARDVLLNILKNVKRDESGPTFAAIDLNYHNIHATATTMPASIDETKWSTLTLS